MDIIIGSARHDEKGKYMGGKPGDSLQTATPDFKGEVSQQKFYRHIKGWNIYRPKSADVANKIAKAMITACNNPNIGYSQSNRYGIMKYGTASTVNCNCDCSSLVRACVKEAVGRDPGDFNTASASTVLLASGHFEYPLLSYEANTPLFTGDILCTKSKGHIVVVTQGLPREDKTDAAQRYTEPTVFLKLKSEGAPVKWLQSMLNICGYNVKVDGKFGKKTEAAVLDVQKKNGLEPNGIVGIQTRRILKRLVNGNK